MMRKILDTKQDMQNKVYEIKGNIVKQHGKAQNQLNELKEDTKTSE
jgi:hypothetical protein